jgi:ABC-type branched-subunit amino acid transport system ATPase component
MNYIKHIKLKNIRGFSELNLDIANENKAARKRTLIIGKNGTCKTTLLRCIAIGLCDIEEGNSLVSEPIGRFITEGKKTAEIQIELFTDDIYKKPKIIIRKLKIKNGKEIVAHQENLLPLPNKLCVCGYGAGRSYEGSDKFREYRIIDSVFSLFNYEETLIPTELTLRRLRDHLGTDIYKHAMKGIMKAIGLSKKDKIELPKGGGVIISGPTIGKSIPLEGWADGYRLTFQWIVDLYAWAMKAGKITPSGGIVGILLVDELEQHCHPSMQTDMLSNLSKLLPDMQIFATTHSPLVVLGASPNEIVALKRKRKYVYSEDVIPDFTGYSAEDMLVDYRIFDTNVYSPETNEKLRQYQKLVSKPFDRRMPKEVQRLKELAYELRSMQIPEVRESPLAEELRKFRDKFDL